MKAQNQAILQGQSFTPMSPLYIGLAEGDAQTDMIATEATAALASGTDTNVVGTAAIQITDNGTLTAEGSKNYRLSAVNGSLTILEKALEGSGETPDKTGGSVPLKPGDLNSGTVQTAVIKDGDGLPRAELETNLTVPVAKALLSQEETEQVERGKDALIYLVLSEADSTASASAKELIEQKAAQVDDEMQVAMFLDLSLFKKIGDEAPEKITDTETTEVTITIALPDNMKQTDSGRTRVYYIIYEHNGVTTVITPTYVDGVLVFLRPVNFLFIRLRLRIR